MPRFYGSQVVYTYIRFNIAQVLWFWGRIYIYIRFNSAQVPWFSGRIYIYIRFNIAQVLWFSGRIYIYLRFNIAQVLWFSGRIYIYIRFNIVQTWVFFRFQDKILNCKVSPSLSLRLSRQLWSMISSQIFGRKLNKIC